MFNALKINILLLFSLRRTLGFPNVRRLGSIFGKRLLAVFIQSTDSKFVDCYCDEI